MTAGTPTASHQSSGDCKVLVCDGMGATRAANDDTDAPDDMNDCTIRQLLFGLGRAHGRRGRHRVRGRPRREVLRGGALAGTCVACVVDGDCPGGTCDANGQCAPVP